MRQGTDPIDSSSTPLAGITTSGDAGELAALTRSLDWSATPLGPMETWPQSLRTVVDTLLNSRFAMWMGWGPELIFFYNDAYRRDTIGVKHPWALGKPFRVVWSEIWRDLEPRIRTVMQTGGATWDEALLLILERSGYREETYHTFSYSPLKNDEGEVAGLLSVVAEVTERVIGERRLALLGDLASKLGPTTGEREVFDAVCAALSANSKDLPFTLTYLYETDGASARLVCSTGIAAGHAAAPERISPGEGVTTPWLDAAFTSGPRRIVEDLADRFASLPTGAWDRPPAQAVVARLARRGQSAPAGFIVVGLNPYRPFDAAYQDFVDLIAGQIASSHANVRAYQEERGRAEALAELDRAKTTFFSNVSHELRTPLTLLLAPVEDVLRHPQLPETLRGPLDVAHRNARRLLKLVNSLLDFSRLEAGRVHASYQATDLADLTAELASNFRSACERAGLALEVDAPPLHEVVYVDHEMWEKVILNLLSNAFKHTFAGGITVRVRDGVDAATVVVEDTGIGIAPEELPRIFERFHRVATARSRTHEGTGIGLALVQEIVRRHGGGIEVDSTPGRGTRFIITLPYGYSHLPANQVVRETGVPGERPREARLLGGSVYLEEALHWLPSASTGRANGAAAIAAVDAPSHVPTGDGTRIVLADDNTDLREYVGRLLQSQGWRVEAVGDGEAALAAVRRERPDLVLSDVMMPRLDGFGLLQALRADSATAAIPIILLSARAGEEARVEGAAAGADDYVVKPFTAQELLARVGAQVRRSRERERSDAAVRAARDLLTNVFEQAPVGICVLRGPNNVFELANAFYRRFLPAGRPIIGRPVREVVPEADAQGFLTLLEGVRTTGVPWIGRDVEIVYDRQGMGQPESAFLNLLYFPLYDDGHIDGVIAVVSEVTDEVRARREADEARRDADEARQAAEAANRAKSDFLAVMSHELRTPLNAIGGYVELIEMGIHGPVTGEQRNALVRISRSQRHLLGLINDVLNLARIETGRVDYLIEPLEVRVVVGQLAAMIEPQMAAKGLEYVVSPPPDLPRVLADRDKLIQILLNLLSNAIKFTPVGGRVTLEASFDEASGRVQLAVMDTGGGIPADKLEVIFEPFVQVRSDHTRVTDGAGLGLAISRDLARGMGGELVVRSAEGQGSTFTLSLPTAIDGSRA